MFVIFPGAVDAEVAEGGAFVAKAETADQGFAGLVAGDDVGFDAVEFEVVESDGEAELQALGHEALAGEGLTDPVAGGAVPEGAAKDLVEADLAQDVAAGAMADEKALRVGGVGGVHEAVEHFFWGAREGFSRGRGIPLGEEGFAVFADFDPFGEVASGGVAEEDLGAGGEGAVEAANGFGGWGCHASAEYSRGEAVVDR